MKSTFKHIHFLPIIVTALISLVVTSCYEDPFTTSDYDPSITVDTKLTLEFIPNAASLTRGTHGEAIKNINDLSIVLYKEDGSFYKQYYFTPNQFTEDTEIDRHPTDKQPADYPSDQLSESKTARVGVTLGSVPVGKYYMYAVANMGVLSESQVETIDKLKTIQVPWQTTSVADPSDTDARPQSPNNQMFGYIDPDYKSDGFDAPLVDVNLNKTNFHAWIKRCASKVTVVYDGSGLHEDIFVYIKKVTIHDIPKFCYLGYPNSPKDLDSLYTNGESIYYNSSDQQLSADPDPAADYTEDYHKWMRVAKGSGLKGAVDENDNPHPETAMAMYFYENEQGKYDVTPTDSTFYKPQIWQHVGQNVYEGDPDYKDNIPHGTYIEVEAYYVSKHDPGISQGKIKYRFMLGQDIISDYNATRNRHYKLTLKFRGYANQADWHIEYEEDIPEIYTPDEFYVSYLYNKQHTFPLRIIGNCKHLEVEIIRNDWHPYDPDGTGEVPDETVGSGNELFRWNRTVWLNDGFEQTAEIPANTTTGDNMYYGRHKYDYTYNNKLDTTLICTPPHAGFLSLTVPTEYESESTPLPKLLFSTNGTHWYSPKASESLRDRGKATVQALRDYYYGEGGDATATNYVKQNIRVFDVSSDGTKGKGRNAYTVSTKSDDSKIVYFPLWTRPFSMIYISGFSGNNPYEAYQRKALLRIRGDFELVDGAETRTITIKKTVPVYQVRRIINPKAIWHSSPNKETFHVVLMQRRNAKTTDFSPFPSEGPWRAKLEVGSSLYFGLSGAKMDGNDVIGETDENIEFDVIFKGNVADNGAQCAIVKVKYHGEQCEHSIFLRRGYNKTLKIAKGDNTQWSAYSLYAANGAFGLAPSAGNATGVKTKSPLAMGSFFKRGNYNDALITSNNVTYGKLVPPYNGNFTVRQYNGSGFTDSQKTWAQIDGKPYTDKSGNILTTKYTWADIEIGDTIYALPTMAQYTSLQENADVGFGVMYGDGATAVGTTFDAAFGFLDPQNQIYSSTKGMRGVVVFNESNGNQIFFPVGFTGVGRRTIQNAASTAEIGLLRYGSQSTVLEYNSSTPWNEHRPISYNLPNNAGAVYWAQNSDTSHNLAWDINFVDLNFSPYDYGCCWGKYGKYEQGNSNLTSKGDALPIKLVYKKNK